jgi:peroxin-12
MRRLWGADYRAITVLGEEKVGPAGGNLGVTSILALRLVGSRVLRSLKFLLPMSIFASKFLEWWHASDFARQLSRKAAEGIELPPPVIAGLRRCRANLDRVRRSELLQRRSRISKAH